MRFTVGTQTQGIFPDGFGEVIALTNKGPWTIYLDNDTSVSELSIPLAPTGSLVWDAHRPLFVKAAGEGSTLVATRNGAAPDVGRAATHEELYRTTNIEMVAGGNGWESPLIECAAYNTLLLDWSVNSTISNTPIAEDDRYSQWLMWWDKNGNHIASEYRQITRPVHGRVAQVIPIRGDQFQIQLSWDPSIPTHYLPDFVARATNRDRPEMLDWLNTSNPLSGLSAVVNNNGGGSGTIAATEKYYVWNDWDSGFPQLWLNNIGKKLTVSVRNTGNITTAGKVVIRYAHESGYNLREIDLPVGPADTKTTTFDVPLSTQLKLLASPAPVTGNRVHITFLWQD